jgi:hypothetical protein
VGLVADPAAAAQVASAARARALRDHSWGVRAETPARTLGDALATASPTAVGGLGRLVRSRDTLFAPYGTQELACTAARRAKRVLGIRSRP